MLQVLENELLRVEVADLGAELFRIYDKEKEREVLWNGDPAYWSRRAPLLFPNVGRHWQDQYRIHGKSYPSRQHGFARDMTFACTVHSDDQIVHELHSDETTRETYPFDFVLRVRHSLAGRRLTVAWEVENPNAETMYFTIGGHPAFRVPVDGLDANADNRYENYQLHFPGKEQLTYLLVDPQGSGTIEAEHPHTLLLKNGSVSLGPLKDGDQILYERFFDLDALVFDHTQFTDVQILLPDGTAYVKVHCEDFPCFGIWAMPGAPFVCLEPWMGRADDKGFTGSLQEKPNVNALESGAVFQKTYDVEIC